MNEPENRFWIRFTWPNDEEDVHCLAVPRVGEHVELPGKNKKYVVVEVLHRLLRAGDGAMAQMIGVALAPLAADDAGAAKRLP